MIEMNPFYAHESPVGPVFDVATWSPRKAVSMSVSRSRDSSVFSGSPGPARAGSISSGKRERPLEDCPAQAGRLAIARRGQHHGLFQTETTAGKKYEFSLDHFREPAGIIHTKIRDAFQMVVADLGEPDPTLVAQET
jgi:hypothetical protein